MRTTTARTAERNQFLADVLVTAIEHRGYGFSYAVEYVYDDDAPENTYAVIRDRYDEESTETFRVTVDTMAKGLGIIRRAIVATVESGEGTYLHNADTFEQLYYGGDNRSDLLLADRTNGEDGDVDVIGALAVLECALFGRVVYA